MTTRQAITLLDGAMGTELGTRGVSIDGPLWSARALDEAPGAVSAIHAAYAAAGATVHTANTFRTKRRQAGERWEELARRAVRLARGAVPAGHRVAGSVSPLDDCYRPDRSPGAAATAEHAELARVLVDAGVDLLLCETFPHVGEALAAVDACAATGVETWVSFTAGPDASLLTPAAIAEGAREAVRRGARAVLVNCVPASDTERFVAAIAGAGVPFGAYANAGRPEEGLGWGAGPAAAEAYSALADRWLELGATIVGGCCGTGPAHIAALAERFPNYR